MVVDHQLRNMIKKFIFTITFCLFTQVSFAAGDSSSESDNYLDKYKSAKKLVNRAKKLESKGKTEKALKLYNSAYEKLLEANKIESRNPDILNYLGFTLRKMGKFQQAEEYYLQGLEIKPDHNGINEYLGELYIQTDRMDKARARLAVLKNCNCEEYIELKELIEKN
jgi:tetratricopeptide (TPR) repeat protein